MPNPEQVTPELRIERLLRAPQSPRRPQLSATEWFARLQALDAHRVARAELCAAGVPERTAVALYPAGFEGIVPGLSALWAEHGVDHWRVAYDWSQVNRRLQQLLAGGLHNSRRKLHEAATAAEEEPDGTIALLSVQLEAMLGISWTTNSIALRIARSIWYAHWFMARRAQLTPALQSVADEHMLWVGQEFLLPLAPGGR